MEFLGCEIMKLEESMPKFNLLKVNLEKEILTISLIRVDDFNALNPELIQELIFHGLQIIVLLRHTRWYLNLEKSFRVL